jgi:hypothetical protein
MTIRVFFCKNGHATRDDTSVQGWPCPECKEPTYYDWTIPGSGPLDPFAWPGGYQIVYITRCGEVLCADCAEESRDNPGEPDTVDGRDVFYEGPSEFCAGCNCEIESAYGDPSESDEVAP